MIEIDVLLLRFVSILYYSLSNDQHIAMTAVKEHMARIVNTTSYFESPSKKSIVIYGTSCNESKS